MGVVDFFEVVGIKLENFGEFFLGVFLHFFRDFCRIGIAGGRHVDRFFLSLGVVKFVDDPSEGGILLIVVVRPHGKGDPIFWGVPAGRQREQRGERRDRGEGESRPFQRFHDENFLINLF